MPDTRRDKPPILRALVLLVALVASALALAALDSAHPDAPAGAQTSGGATGDRSTAPSR